MAEAEGNSVVACSMFVVVPFVFGPAFEIKLYAFFLVRHYSLHKEEKVGYFTLIVFLIFCLWSLCLDICGRAVKLSFFSCGFNGVRQTMAENTHCWGVIWVAVMYVMTSLKLFSFKSVEKSLLSFCLMFHILLNVV